MLSSALFVGAALLLSRAVPPLMFGMSAPGAAAAVVSIALGLRVWWAINKSGHLDQKRKD